MNEQFLFCFYLKLHYYGKKSKTIRLVYLCAFDMNILITKSRDLDQYKKNGLGPIIGTKNDRARNQSLVPGTGLVPEPVPVLRSSLQIIWLFQTYIIILTYAAAKPRHLLVVPVPAGEARLQHLQCDVSSVGEDMWRILVQVWQGQLCLRERNRGQLGFDWHRWEGEKDGLGRKMSMGGRWEEDGKKMGGRWEEGQVIKQMISIENY